MRTRLFLRTAEVLWQEGHTAHSTADEAIDETRQMLDVYAKFAEDFMAMPVVRGRKTASERFAGAEDTLCIESLMQDGKALQAGTSHFLGQNFAKAFDVKFADKEGKLEYVWATSGGVSTRLMGALIMCHSDDEGLVLPPRLAPIQVVAVPIYRSEEELSSISERMLELKKQFKEKGISFKYDDDDNRRPGWKFSEYETKGVPVRLAMGPRDLANGKIEIVRRDTKEKKIVDFEGVSDYVDNLLQEMQEHLFQRALDFKNNSTIEVDDFEAFKKAIKEVDLFLLIGMVLLKLKRKLKK